jgi:hypothetical protein
MGDEVKVGAVFSSYRPFRPGGECLSERRRFPINQLKANPMQKLFSRGGGLLAGLTLSAALFTTGVYALIVPQAFPPRQFPTQQVHYTRFVVSFNDCTLVANTCSTRRGALPYNAYIMRASQQVTTAFNSATTDTLALATTSGGAQIVAAQTVHALTAGLPLTIVAANLGIAATGNGIAQTGAEGGFDIWAVYAQTGAAATAGAATIVLEWIAPNDGSCVYVAQGATSPAC